MATTWNPAEDLMKGYAFVEGVQDRQHARERRETLEQRQGILWERGTEEWERDQKDRVMRRAYQRIAAHVIDPKTGEVNWDRARQSRH